MDKNIPDSFKEQLEQVIIFEEEKKRQQQDERVPLETHIEEPQPYLPNKDEEEPQRGVIVIDLKDSYLFENTPLLAVVGLLNHYQ